MPSHYQVFISHAGEDKQALATPLYEALKNRGIQAFLDQAELPVGENAPKKMNKNMETAPIGLFILRPEFLAKPWPMKELFCFQRRLEEAERQGVQPPLLIPVFYGMTVSECGDEDIFNSMDKNGKNLFSKFGFFKRAKKNETSVQKVLQAAEMLSKHAGVRNDDNANNEDTDEMAKKRKELVRKIANIVEKAVGTLSLPRSSGHADFFTPDFFVPPLPSHIILDFETRDSNGNYVTVEGRFKHKLWSAIRRDDGTSVAAIGRSSDGVPGLTGMGGVGKSVSLIALAYEGDIRNEFKDGIYFILLGEQADAAHVIEELARVVSKSGGCHIAKQIREAGGIGAAVDGAASWFKGKKVLFLLDDLWETESRTLGFFKELKRLVSANGRIAVTTRNKDIAEAAGFPVYFDPREAQGKVSRAMLFEYAGLNSHTAKKSACDDAVESILAHCAGLPLALGIAGRAISQRIADGDVDWRGAMSWYARRVGAGAGGLVHEPFGEYEKTLQEAVKTSLDMADKWAQSDRAGRIFGKKLVLSELYIRLGVLRKQARVPLSMLSKLWGLHNMERVEDIVIKLSKWNLLSKGKRIGVHDLLLDVCVHEARRKGMIESYHKALLEAYNCPVDEDGAEVGISVHEGEGNVRGVLNSAGDIELDTVRPNKRVKHSPGAIMRNRNEHVVARAWWKEDLDEDGYLAENLARHLVAGGNAGELRKLLCDARWTGHRVKARNVLAWEGDFAELLSGMEVVGKRNIDGGELKRGLEAIRDSVMLSWPFLMKNPNELAFQVFGRLHGVEENVTVVGEYLRSTEQSAKRPWLKPMTRCFSSPESPVKMELDLTSAITTIAISPTKPQAFAGVGSDIHVVDLERRKVVLMLEEHSREVICVAIAPDGNRVVSGSRDRTVRVWDVQTMTQVGKALKGHSEGVSCVVITPDGNRVVSGSWDKTVCVWDMQKMTQVGEALQGHSNWVSCVAITPDGNRVVSGSRDGTLRVWDMRTRTQIGDALKGHSGGVSCVAITPDGNRVVSGSRDCTLRVWDIQAMTQVREALEGHSHCVNCVAVTLDGNRVVSGSDDCTLRMWDIQTMTQVEKALKGHSGGVSCVTITPDGNRVVSGSWDRMLRVWDMQTMTQVGEVPKGHSQTVRSVTISPDGKHIVSVSVDGAAIVWKIGTGEAIGKEVTLPNHDWWGSTVQISRGNVVTIDSNIGKVVRLRIDEGLGLVVLPNLDNCPEDSVEEGGEMSQVTTTSMNVLLQFPHKQLLATFTDMNCSAFDMRSKSLVIGHKSGAVSFHKLIE